MVRRGSLAAFGLALLMWGPAAPRAEEAPKLGILIDHGSLVQNDCAPVAQAVGAIASALPDLEVEVLVTRGHNTVRPAPTEAAVRGAMCGPSAFQEAAASVGRAEAFEILRRNEAVRDAVLRRVCGATPPSGCGARIGAEAQDVAQQAREDTNAFLAMLQQTVHAGAFDALVLVSAGPPTPAISKRLRKQLQGAAQSRRLPVAILAVPPAVPGTLAGMQNRALADLRQWLDASTTPLGDAREIAKVLADRFAPVGLGSATAARRGGVAVVARRDAAEIVRLAAAHVVEFARQASVVLAYEDYEQQIKSRAGSFGLSGSTRMGIVRQHRTLRSEVALVQVLDGAVWMIARDVLAVDGRALGQRPPLAASIPTDSVESALRYLRQVADAGARFNLGDIRRNLNTPTLALLPLLDAFRHRFEFRKRATDEHGPVTLAFEERVEPTLFQINASSARTAGRLWVDPQTGAVTRSELVLASHQGAPASATITVDYQYVPAVGSWMPVKMTEKYEEPGKRESDWIECVATYSQFRRFTVTSKIR